MAPSIAFQHSPVPFIHIFSGPDNSPKYPVDKSCVRLHRDAPLPYLCTKAVLEPGLHVSVSTSVARILEGILERL